MSFDITMINWLLRLIDPTISLATLGQEKEDKTRLLILLKKLTVVESLLNAPQTLINELQHLEAQLQQQASQESFIPLYRRLRHYFESKPWVAITIPSGDDHLIDRILYDEGLMLFHVKTKTASRGLIIQLDKARLSDFAVLDIHPALPVLLNQRLDWPGLFVLIPGADSLFLPVSSAGYMEIDIEARLQWIFNKLFAEKSLKLKRLQRQYQQAFSEVYEQDEKTLHLLHISDLAIGLKETAFRLHHLKRHIRHLIDDLGEKNRIVPVITGNLLANPSEEQLEDVGQFWRFLKTLGVEPPLFVFGNNDVRNDGNINMNYRHAIDFQTEKISWFEREKLAIISLNSVVHGNLPEGFIGQEQIDSIEFEITRKPDSEDYQFILLIHHSPLWRQQQTAEFSVERFYQTVYGTNRLPLQQPIKNAEKLQAFCQKFPVIAWLHGHSALSTVFTANEKEVPVVACGMSRGIYSGFDNQLYYPINLVTINRAKQKTTVQLKAITAENTSLNGAIQHEIVTCYTV
jgi:hypothetical protein